MKATEEERSALQHYARHFVTIEAIYDTLPQEGKEVETKSFVISAFLVSMLDRWIIVTAGHVLQDIEKYRRGGIKFGTWTLLDHWGPDSIDDTGIPFELDKAAKRDLYDLDEHYLIGSKVGADYGIILVSPMYQALMEKNGIVPITEEAWAPLEVDYDRYFMLGVPEERNKTIQITSDLKGNTSYLVSRELLQIGIKNLHTIPDYMERINPSLYGQISDPLILDDEVILEGIGGMIGCPIFGIKGDKYWLVAMQSHWYSKTHYIRAVGMCDFATQMKINLLKAIKYAQEHPEEE